MKKVSYLITCFIPIVGCASLRPLGSASLVVKPEFGFQSQTQITPYGIGDINHLTIKLFTTAEQDLGISKDLPNASLGNTVVFSNLRVNTNYRIRAYAYASAGTGSCISTNDANCYVDASVGTDNAPTITSLKVKLIDKPFNGQGTGSIAVTPGGYELPFPEQMEFSLQGSVSILAGNGTFALLDGSGTNASVGNPVGITCDSQGNLYIGDSSNNAIRKITQAGVVSTVAGGSSGSSDGIGTQASFKAPMALTVDSQGNIFVAELSNHGIRKIATDGTVTTFAGGRGSGFSDGQGTSAKFYEPRGLTIDSHDNLFVIDRGNSAIRKVTPTGEVTTFAGNGASGFANGYGTSASFYYPHEAAFDPSGNLYIGDQGNVAIRKITPEGLVSTFIGGNGSGFADGQGVEAKFNTTKSLDIDSNGVIYLVDTGNNAIRKITPSGMVTTLAGNGSSGLVDGYGASAKFNQPYDCTLFGDYVFVSDTNNRVIRRIHK